ncbi:MAG: dockerin type I repeat-containing protein [Blastocatellia bacterium]
MLSANGTPAASLTTGMNGVFQLTGLARRVHADALENGDVNGISSFDAALVALHVVGASTLSSCQQVAGDASNNGALSSFDAALIAQAVVGIPNGELHRHVEIRACAVIRESDGHANWTEFSMLC